MKVAICFFGITRRLENTLSGIRENLLAPLEAAGIESAVFLHCLTMEVLSNERSGEAGCEVDPDGWTALCPPGPNALAEPQELVDEELDHEQYQRHPDPWKDGFASMKNHVRALYSQRRVLELIPDPLSFDAIFSVRPDLLYTTPFDPAWIQALLGDETLLLPEFAGFGGLNDRFAVGSPAAMMKYMRRGEDYRALHLSRRVEPSGTWWWPFRRSRRSNLTGERFLAAWVEGQGIKVRHIPWTFARVRANGLIAENDLEYVTGGA